MTMTNKAGSLFSSKSMNKKNKIDYLTLCNINSSLMNFQKELTNKEVELKEKNSLKNKKLTQLDSFNLKLINKSLEQVNKSLKDYLEVYSTLNDNDMVDYSFLSRKNLQINMNNSHKENRLTKKMK